MTRDALKTPTADIPSSLFRYTIPVSKQYFHTDNSEPTLLNLGLVKSSVGIRSMYDVTMIVSMIHSIVLFGVSPSNMHPR